MSDVTKADLIQHGDRILAEMRRGFDGVHSRQDITNGRVQKLEVELGRQDERLKGHDSRIRGLGRQVYGRRDSDRGSVSWRDSLITKRDVAVVMGTVTIVVAAMKFIAWLQPALAVVKP